MTGWFNQLSGGQATWVKVVLTTVLAALAVYPVFLAAVFYGKLRLPLLIARSQGQAICYLPGRLTRAAEHRDRRERESMAVTNKAARGVFACLLAVVAAFAAPALPAASAPSSATSISSIAHSDRSAPLSSLPPARNAAGGHLSHPARALPGHPSAPVSSSVPQPLVAQLMPAPITNFEGIGQGFSGPAGAFSVASAPPDPNAAVGPNHVVELVNTDLAIFDKTGTPIFGPVPTNTLWSTFGGGCQANNDGDGTVAYDRIADRWVIAQFSVSTTPYLYCVAVSATPDPTGAYNRYSFNYGNTDFVDYPKLGVWPDAYYVTYNVFANATSFSGAKVCALDRTKMLAGQAATQQCFNTGITWGGLLPSDLDGSRLPPTGEPNTQVAFGANLLGTWKFHVDWVDPANTTFTGPTNIPVAAFSDACNDGTCIPQAGTTQQLSSLGDRLMYRLAYRNFGDHESLVANHSVTAGSSVGVRWYELRLSPGGGAVSLFQQGTYAPDSNYRWMGSIAQDSAGDMALGFSLSGSGIHPQIHYTGRLAGDAAGTMGQGEGTIINGAGSQSGGSLDRWGDYTSMSIDPVDDCTFWYTNQYQAVTGAFNWHTRIGSFKFPNCGVPPPPDDFSISASPSSLSMAPGGSGTSAISTAVISGSAGTVSLTASAPAGITATLSPTSVTAGGSSILTVGADATLAPGTYSVTVTGIEGSISHDATVTVTVTQAPPPDDFSIAASPGSLSMAPGGSGTSTISTAVISGSAGSVSLSATAPAGITASLSPTSVTAGGSSTLTVGAGAAMAPGSYNVTVTGVEGSGSATHSTTVTVNVTAPPPPNDFSISANPSSISVIQGGSGSSTISTTVTSGSAGSVSLSATAPAGITASLSPSSVTAGGSSILTITADAALVPGPYTVTVTGTEGSMTHSVSVTVNVSPIPTGIVNGGFETGDLTGWTATGSASVVAEHHSGSFAALVGSTSPTNGDSSIAQTFTVPAAGGALSFWYAVKCPDTITYDWATATLRDNTAGTTSTVLPKTCPATYIWTNRTAPLTGGHSYTLTLLNHDDNYVGDATYTLYDDVAIVPPPPPPPTGISNGDFETGNLNFWTAIGSTAAVTTAQHGGSYSARVGSTTAFNGDSSIAQTFSAPIAGGTLSFWYRVVCTDTVTYDWATATLRDNTAGTTTTMLPKTCGNLGTWANRSAALTGGHAYTLTLVDHDDNFSTDPTYTLFDDVAIAAPPPPVPNVITNGGFETGSLSGWTATGSVAASTASRSGTYAARVGSTTAFSGDSSIAQTFTAPAGSGTLSFWYRVVCTDTVTFDWATATLRDNTAGTTATVLPKTCTNAGAWVVRSVALTAGHSYTLTLVDHDDNYATDPTYTLFDDVVTS